MKSTGASYVNEFQRLDNMTGYQDISPSNGCRAPWCHDMETHSVLLALCEGKPLAPVEPCPHPHSKGQCGALICSLMLAWTSSWANTRDAMTFIWRHCNGLTGFDVTVLAKTLIQVSVSCPSLLSTYRKKIIACYSGASFMKSWAKSETVKHKAYFYFMNEWIHDSFVATPEAGWNLLPFLKLGSTLTHLPLDKMAAILQMIFLNTFSWMTDIVFWLEFQLSLFPGVQLIIFQYWLRQWLGAVQVISNYLNQWWHNSFRWVKACPHAQGCRFCPRAC